MPRYRIVLNDDKELIKEIDRQLDETGGYCPCKLPPYTKNDKCMCKEFRTDFAKGKVGECHCGKYKIIKED